LNTRPKTYEINAPIGLYVLQGFFGHPTGKNTRLQQLAGGTFNVTLAKRFALICLSLLYDNLIDRYLEAAGRRSVPYLPIGKKLILLLGLNTFPAGILI